MNAEVNWTVVITMCRCRFVDYNNYIPVAQGVDNGGDVGGQEVYGNFLYLPLSFAVNLKVLWKMKFTNFLSGEKKAYLVIASQSSWKLNESMWPLLNPDGLVTTGLRSAKWSEGSEQISTDSNVLQQR